MAFALATHWWHGGEGLAPPKEITSPTIHVAFPRTRPHGGGQALPGLQDEDYPALYGLEEQSIGTTALQLLADRPTCGNCVGI
jgi:hypothetical protein